ncbi:MAG: hypothetical protein IJW77_09980 [Clostridia bacterium]|nr:hypothetical protein [Clostridia bacterium]
MKKAYVKPQIVFEDFSLNTNIAGDCERIVNNPSEGSCGMPGSMPGLTLFINVETGCNFELNSEEHDGICYHVPVAGSNLFNS